MNVIDYAVKIPSLGYFVCASGIACNAIAHIKTNKLKEYEFNNRTSGGVVEFATYREAKKHRSRLAWFYTLKRIGSLLIFVGGCLIFIDLSKKGL